MALAALKGLPSFAHPLLANDGSPLQSSEREDAGGGVERRKERARAQEGHGGNGQGFRGPWHALWGGAGPAGRTAHLSGGRASLV